MTTATEVRTSIVVPVTPERAFEVFTKWINGWWTREHHVQAGTLKEIGIDPHAGGRMWEESDTGEVCTWGRVLTWDPPSSFSFSWLIGPDWAVPPPDAVGSRVTVTFTAIGSGTGVDLVHDLLDAHGEGWESVANGVGSPAGWPAGLRQFAAVV
jgi:uncharacterized protein YndB with AHSA1/START domain